MPNIQPLPNPLLNRDTANAYGNAAQNVKDRFCSEPGRDFLGVAGSVLSGGSAIVGGFNAATPWKAVTPPGAFGTIITGLGATAGLATGAEMVNISVHGCR
jgi:hypothetical protein